MGKKEAAATTETGSTEVATEAKKHGIMADPSWPNYVTGETRAEYIKRRIFGDEKATRSQVAKDIGVKYQIVYATIKPELKKSGDFSPGKVQKAAPAAPAATDAPATA